MAKVAIKNVNITSFGGIYHIMDVFSKLGFEKLTESVLGKRGSSGKAFCYGSIFCGFSYFPIGLGGGFYAQKRAKKHRSSSYQHIGPKKTSQHIKFSHKKKYCGIKDIRVLFYSSIFQMIIVFPFIVLKYISFCCHSSHLVLCCNRLVYSCFILIVKSDSKLILNSSCQSFKSFHICLSSFFVNLLSFVFLFPNLFILYFFLYVTLSLCHSVSLIALSFFVILSLFHLFVAHSLPYFSFYFQLSFYGFIYLFFDLFA